MKPRSATPNDRPAAGPAVPHPAETRLKAVAAKLADIRAVRFPSSQQQRLILALESERERLVDVIETDRHQVPLFPESA